MPIEICKSDDVFSFMGITPTGPESDAMDMIKNGLESSTKKYCRWHITEATKTAYLPLTPTALGKVVPSSEVYNPRPLPTGTRNRLQLPSSHVKSITTIHEDYGARAGATGDFPSGNLLVDGQDYFLEKDEGSAVSESGAVMRVGTNWSSIPGTIKAVFVAGFSESELAGEFNGLRFALLQECVESWFKRQMQIKKYVTGLGPGSDTSGLLTREKLGDYEVGFAKSTADPKDDAGSYGLSEKFKKFLEDEGYVFCAVGV